MRDSATGLTTLYGDHLGSASVAVTSSGAVQRMRYKPWGEARGTSAGAFATDRLYTGQLYDGDTAAGGTGLYFYNARYYDPALGRFTQADTIVPDPANPLAFDRYAYSLNNPVKYTDPDGHFPILPFILKAGANGAADFVAQAALNYLFNPNILSVDQAIASVNMWQVGRSTLEGLIPWRTPGGRLGRAALTAAGDVVVNALSYGSSYSTEQAFLDFGIGFIGDLGGGGMGSLLNTYGVRNVASGLRKLGLNVESVLVPTLTISNKQFGTKARQHMDEWGLDVRSATDRDAFRNIIQGVYANYDEYRIGSWNPNAGGGHNYVFLRQGTTILIMKPDGTFVTIMQDARNNRWWNQAINPE